MSNQIEHRAAGIEGRSRASKTPATEPPIPQTLDQWRAYLRSRLSPLSDTPGLDARVLLAHVLQQPQSWLLTHPDYPLTQKETHHLGRALFKLLEDVPLPYVLGQWEFFGLTFQLSPEVLIPRPETELLVEEALAWLTEFPGRRRAIDLGTGSGCIAVSLAKHCPDLAVIATDISPEAVNTARQNAHRHQVDRRITFRQGALWDPVEGRFDLICTNLPYIPTETLRRLPVYGREPTLALEGGPDGLDLLRKFLHQAPKFLGPGGLLLAEIEAGQGSAVLALAKENFPKSRVQVLSDLAGKDRLLRIESYVRYNAPAEN